MVARRLLLCCAYTFAFSNLAEANNGQVAIALPIANVQVDGDLSEWNTERPNYPVALNIFGDPEIASDDFRASYRVGFDQQNARLYVAIEVEDDSFVVDPPNNNTFDSVTVSLGDHGRKGVIGSQVWHRGSAPTKEYPHSKIAMQTSGNSRTYEFRIDLAKLNIPTEAPFTCSWSIEINDVDEDGTESLHSWSPQPWKMFSRDRHGDLIVCSDFPQKVTGRVILGTNRRYGFSAVRFQSTSHPNLVAEICTDAQGRYHAQLPRGTYKRTLAGQTSTIEVADGAVEDHYRTSMSDSIVRPLRITKRWKQGNGQIIRKTIPFANTFQPNPVVRQFTSADNLPDSTIYDLAQSSDGTIWTASATGVFSFDGIFVTHYRAAREARVHDVHIVDNDGREEVWIGSERGLWIIDRESLTISRVRQFKNRIVRCIATGHDGKIHVGTGRGLFVKESSGFRAFAPGEGAESNIRSLCADEAFTWVGTDSGLYRFQNEKFEQQSIGEFDNHRVSCLYLDSNSSLWLGTSSALFRGVRGEFQEIHSQNKERFRYVRDIVQDQNGDVWAATWDGTIHVGSSNILEPNPEYHHTRTPTISDLTIDRDNNRWLSFEEGDNRMTCTLAAVKQYVSVPCEHINVTLNEISFTAQVEGQWFLTEHERVSQHAGKRPEIRSRKLPSKPTLLERDKQLLVGTEDGLYVFDDNKLAKHPIPEFQAGNISDIQKDRNNNIWVATPKAFYRVDGDQVTNVQTELQLPDERATLLAESKSGSFAIATHFGLSVIEDGNSILLCKDNGLNSNVVSALHWSRDGRLWIGSTHGLQSYLNGSFQQHWSPNSSRNGNFGAFLTEDVDGHIWAGSHTGVGIVDPERNVAQMMHSENYFGPAGIRNVAIDGEFIWLSSRDGLFRFQKPKSFPGIVIDNITSDRTMASTKEVSLTTDQPLLAFHYHVIHPSSRNGSAIYRYRLDGYDDRWSDTASTNVKYNNLPSGKYSFEVQAFDVNLQPSNIISIPVTVHPPYARYAMTCAMAISLCGLLGLGLFTLRKQSKEKDELAVRVKQEVAAKNSLSRQLQNAQKLESLGTLAAGIAHDFNNSLQVMLLNAQLGLREPKDIAKIHSFLHDISKSSKQASELTKSLLLFGDRTPGIRRPANLNQIVQTCAKMIRRTIPTCIGLNVELSPNKVWCRVDETQIHQALVNLCINARDAMPNGGQLSISVSSKSIGSSQVAVLRICDDGDGISDELIEMVFDPFFTSKPREKGTGLGLSIVHGIVSSHEGTVTLESALNAGTQVEIQIPCCEPNPAIASGSDSIEDTHGQGLILIADDQTIVRRTIKLALESRGYFTIEAVDGVETLEMVSTNPAIDMLILDIDMPKLGGKEVMQRLRENGWKKRIVIVTGSPTNTPKLDSNSCFVSKPFTLEGLLAAVQTTEAGQLPGETKTNVA